MTRRLNVIVCGAGPASDVHKLISAAHARSWDVQLIATPSGLGFIDVDDLEQLTGHPVRSEYRNPGEPRSPKGDALIIAPATYNTVNKLAIGASDTYALGVAAEMIGLGLPVVVMPFINKALASRQPWKHAVDSLQAEGVAVLTGTPGVEPHEPGTGDELVPTYPWTAALDAIDERSPAHGT